MNRYHLLLIEDEVSIARIVTRRLERAGYQVSWAVNGRDGLAQLEGASYDLVLLDFRMPLLDGLGVLRLLAKRDNQPPAIMLSGVSDLDVVVEAMKLGAADYVIKDVVNENPSLLLSAIDKALESFALKAALRREKERAVQYLATAGTMILALDQDGEVVLVNNQACSVLGMAEDEIKGRHWVDTFVPADQQRELHACLAGLLDGSVEVVENLEGSVLTADADERVISWNFNPMHEDGYISRLLLSGIDITSRKQAEAALSKSEERYALATEAAKVGVWDWDLEQGSMYIDPHLKRALGYEASEMPDIPEAWRACIHEDDRDMVWSAISGCLQGRRDYCEVEHRMVCKDGMERWFITRARAAQDGRGGVVRLTGTDTDITDLKLAEAHIEHMATHDFLTGLPNRMLLQDRLAMALAHARRDRSMVAVLFVDLDGFKPINDAFGHDTGDEVLQQVARRLQGQVRASDTVARFGGDEFILAFSRFNDLKEASRLANKTLDTICRPMIVGDDQEIAISASIGVAIFPKDGELPDQLLKAADAAMYAAKRTGKCAFAFAPETNRELV